MKEPRPGAGAGSGDSLVRALLAGDAGAVRQVRRLVQGVVRYRGYYIPAEERADVVQSVMLEVWRSLCAEAPAAPRSLDALVRSIACRRCVDWIRRRRAADAVRELPAGQARRPDTDYLDAEQRRLGSVILSRIRPACRELFRLHAVQALSYREMAGRLGRSEGALRTQMSECLKEAREIHRRLVSPQPAGKASAAGSDPVGVEAAAKDKEAGTP